MMFCVGSKLTAQDLGKPNIVFILTDDQTRSTLRHMPELQSRLVGHGRIMDEMVSKMQSSTESMDSIAENAIKQELGPKAIADPKRRKTVTLAPDAAGTADLPPDATEALTPFAQTARPGAVVDSPLGSGPVLVVARAIR